MGIGGIAGGFPWMPGQVERNNQKSFAYRSVYETVSVYLNGKLGRAAILQQLSFLLNAICMACSFINQQQADFTETSKRFTRCHKP